MCQHGECINTMGSFRCDCKPGYKFDEPSHQCIDNNECNQQGKTKILFYLPQKVDINYIITTVEFDYIFMLQNIFYRFYPSCMLWLSTVYKYNG